MINCGVAERERIPRDTKNTPAHDCEWKLYPTKELIFTWDIRGEKLSDEQQWSATL